MPVNKKALTRYLAYDNCLRNSGRKWSWLDLRDAADEVLNEEGLEGISRTQFYADIKYMKNSSWQAPIQRTTEGGRVYFSYSDPTYTIGDKPLSDNEAELLKSAVAILTRFTGAPQFDWVHEIIPTLESKLGLVTTEKEIISFDSNIDYEGRNNISPFFDAIINSRSLVVSYRDFDSEFAYDIRFHPHYLKQYNGRWYVLGLNSANNQPDWIMALDRVKGLLECDEEYIESNIDWDEHFSEFIGVTFHKDHPMVEIKLLIMDEQQAAYIKTKPLHESQMPIKRVEDGFVTSIKVVPNYELKKLILSFGGRIKVISPKTFQDDIKQAVQSAAELYSG